MCLMLIVYFLISNNVRVLRQLCSLFPGHNSIQLWIIFWTFFRLIWSLWIIIIYLTNFYSSFEFSLDEDKTNSIHQNLKFFIFFLETSSMSSKQMFWKKILHWYLNILISSSKITKFEMKKGGITYQPCFLRSFLFQILNCWRYFVDLNV